MCQSIATTLCTAAIKVIGANLVTTTRRRVAGLSIVTIAIGSAFFQAFPDSHGRARYSIGTRRINGAVSATEFSAGTVCIAGTRLVTHRRRTGLGGGVASHSVAAVTIRQALSGMIQALSRGHMTC